ncbi:MAG TPA: hypothetical protein VG248_17240 [Caulobacteraceae bacterium]|nr:hypothetical protein [Caulobacteraceae bacterium]
MRLPPDWRAIFARVVRLYGWSPGDALALTWSDLTWWAAAALDGGA